MVGFPAPSRYGYAVHRSELAHGIDFVSVTLSGHEFPPHVHEGYTIGLVHGGCVEYWCRGERRVCGPGTLFALNPGEVHTGRAATKRVPAQYHVIYPRADVIGALLGSTPFLEVPASEDQGLVDAFTRLARERSALTSSLRAILLRLGPATGTTNVMTRRGQLIATTRDFLLKHLRGRPSLDSLGRTLGFHPAYLRRVFKQETGLSPRSYLLQLRVMRARQLLGRGASIAHVVREAGFTDQSYLTHEFRRTMGFTPASFQRALGYR